MVALVVGVLVADLLLGDVRSLKEKRGVVRPVIAELRRRFEVSVAETGQQDLYRRAEVSVALVSGEHGHIRAVLDSCERLLAGRPELELLAVRRRTIDSDDLD